MKCPYCSAAAPGRCATTPTARSITECTACGRVVEEHQTLTHHIFHLRAQDSPLLLSTSDLPSPPPLDPTTTTTTISDADDNDDDDDNPFHHTGFITAFSTFSLEHVPIYALSTLSFSGQLAELERALESSSSTSSNSSGGGGVGGGGGVVVDNLRAYMQVLDVASILGVEREVVDHAFQLFRDCSSATCLRNRSVEGLATACLVQAIREAQEPRTLQVLGGIDFTLVDGFLM